MDHTARLPSCILSHILSFLSIKDSANTVLLSKSWSKIWLSRRHLSFDILNVLGSEEDLLRSGFLIDVPSGSTTKRRFSSAMCSRSRNQFASRVDYFVNNFNDLKIDSFRLNFYFDSEQRSTIDKWLEFAMSKSVENIDLLFLGRPYAHDTATTTFRGSRYKFDLSLFSETETNASILNHLGLENCIVLSPIKSDIVRFKNLRSLSLEEVKLHETIIESVLSNSPLLQELCLLFCEFQSSMPMIVSSSLCCLKAIGCYIINPNSVHRLDKSELNLIALNCLKLTSLELHCLLLTSSEDGLDILKFNTPMLKSIKFSISLKQKLNKLVDFCAKNFPMLEVMNVTTFSMVTTSLDVTTQPLKHLNQLNLTVFVDSYILDDQQYDTLWILNILQSFPLLRKLSVMFAAPKFSTNQKEIRDVATFFHDELKVIELKGCVGNWYEIEFVRNVLKYASKLEQIVVSPCWREADSLDWKSDPIWVQSGRESMRQKLQGEEVVGREKLVFK